VFTGSGLKFTVAASNGIAVFNTYVKRGCKFLWNRQENLLTRSCRS